MNFFEAAFLWRDAVIASVALAAALSIVGVYSTLRRTLFLPAALSGISGLAAVSTVFVMLLIHGDESHAHGWPALSALLATLAGALLLGMWKPGRASREQAVGMAYIATSAFILLLGDRMPAETGHLEDIIFGNAVIVEAQWMWIALLTSVAVVALHLRHARLFFFVSFDPDAAAASGVPIRWVDGLLFVSMGLSIAVATRTIGSLPVFAVAVFPAAAALQLFKTPVAILLCAASLGAISAFVGYWLSFEMGFPTGACTAACSIVPLMVVALRRLRRR